MTSIVASLLTALLKMLKPETVRYAVDKLLDIIEDAVAKSPNKYDDAVVLPLCVTIRQALNVPDND